jgi:photosystem II stability/assembly factor-like uncharacterized protein
VCGLALVALAAGAAAPAGAVTGPYTGLSGADLTQISIDPANAAVIEVGSAGGSLPGGESFVTTDSGASWSAQSGLQGNVVAYDPSRPGVEYQASSTQVLRSGDGGQTWSAVLTFSNSGVRVSVTDSGRVWVVNTTLNTVAYSDDQGVTWTQADSGLPDPSHDNPLGFAAAPGGDGVAYIAEFDSASGQLSVYRFDPGSGDWVATATPYADGPSGTFLTVSPTDSDQVFMATLTGVFRSDDGGASWNPVMVDESPPYSDASFCPVAISVGEPDVMYVCTQSGIGASSDGGQSFSAPVDVFQGETPRAIAIDPDDANTLYAVDAAGVFESTDGDQSWTPVNNGITSTSFVLATASDPADPSIVYAGTEGGFWRSGDGGQTWQYSETGLEPNTTLVTSITLDPQDPSTVYLDADTGYYVSHDAGVTWTHLGSSTEEDANNVPHPVAVDPENDQHLVIPDFQDVLVSNDGGQTFTTDPIPLVDTWEQDFQNVARVAVDPADPSVLFAGGVDGVWRSGDDGATWTRALFTGHSAVGYFQNAAILTVDPTDPGVVYYGQSRDPLWVSEDGGTTWQTPLPEDFETVSLALDSSTTPSTAYATGYLNGASATYRSTDGGQTWVPEQPADAASTPGLTSTALAQTATLPGVAHPVRELYEGAATVTRAPFIAETPQTAFVTQTRGHVIRVGLNTFKLRVSCHDTWAARCAGSVRLTSGSSVVARPVAFNVGDGGSQQLTFTLSLASWWKLDTTGKLTLTAWADTTADRTDLTGERTYHLSAVPGANRYLLRMLYRPAMLLPL